MSAYGDDQRYPWSPPVYDPPAPVDWPARFLAAAKASPPGSSFDRMFRQAALIVPHTPPAEVAAVGRALLGEGEQ
jgi:hypothetical protein